MKHADYVSDAVDKEENRAYKINKLKDFAKCTLEKKLIWIKVRIATKKLKKHKNYFKE